MKLKSCVTPFLLAVVVIFNAGCDSPHQGDSIAAPDTRFSAEVPPNWELIGDGPSELDSRRITYLTEDASLVTIDLFVKSTESINIYGFLKYHMESAVPESKRKDLTVTQGEVQRKEGFGLYVEVKSPQALEYEYYAEIVEVSLGSASAFITLHCPLDEKSAHLDSFNRLVKTASYK
ncbi:MULTISPECIES: hypothetical protein [Corallincola]|uniref:Uncharacterized protein n=2 Tax=Corallincola TaxID=1775176 RepID=A0A368NH96_9GAMM|nr:MULTISPECIES: hypothetical protein [Corallincola]RCU48761.1 hypothetical protein DU002_13285 [Corallincola holothuriorum]TAA42657.1 hypothetical protein EXY25_15325 [Corallincola spongiicola]